MSNETAVSLDVGAKVGYWTIQGKPVRVGRDYKVTCLCECGVVKEVSAISLRAGHSKHCGCMQPPAKRKSESPVLTDSSRLTSQVQEELSLISQGCLPLADQFCVADGAPAWTLSSIAMILGISRSELLDHLARNGQRFSAEMKSQLAA